MHKIHWFRVSLLLVVGYAFLDGMLHYFIESQEGMRQILFGLL